MVMPSLQVRSVYPELKREVTITNILATTAPPNNPLTGTQVRQFLIRDPSRAPHITTRTETSSRSTDNTVG